MVRQILALITLLVSAAGCPAVGGNIDKMVTVPIPPQDVATGGVLGSLLSLAGYNFSISESTIGTVAELEGVTGIGIEAMGLRTVLSASSDRTNEALKDEGAIEKCRAGQLPISWLYSVKVYVQKPGRPETAQLLAWHDLKASERDSDSICGFFLDTDNAVNIADFLPDYETRIDATGKPPRTKTTIGGFVTISYRMELGL